MTDEEWDTLVHGRSARDRAYGLSISEPTPPARIQRGRHIAQSEGFWARSRRFRDACGGVGGALIAVSAVLLAAVLRGVRVR